MDRVEPNALRDKLTKSCLWAWRWWWTCSKAQIVSNRVFGVLILGGNPLEPSLHSPYGPYKPLLRSISQNKWLKINCSTSTHFYEKWQCQTNATFVFDQKKTAGCLHRTTKGVNRFRNIPNLIRTKLYLKNYISIWNVMKAIVFN